MSGPTYAEEAAGVALTIWEQSTGNGRDLPQEQWDEHMQNCHAAAANTFLTGMSLADWEAAALARITGDTTT